VTRH